MTVSTTDSRTSDAGNGVTVAFTFPYLFFADSDLTVILVVDATGVETTQTLTTHYTVTGAGVGTGTVTMVTAPASGETLVIIREQPYTQLLNLVDNDSLPAENVEQAFDKAVLLIQQVNNLIGRSFVLAAGDDTGISLTLPVMQASKLLQVKDDISGIQLAAAADISLTLVSAFAETLIDDVDDDAFIQTLFGSANISTFRTTVALAASETVAGDIELATQAEVTTGTDALKAVTPATLAGDASYGYKLVETQTLTSGLTAEFETGFDADYDHMFTFKRVFADVADTLQMRVKEASSWIAGATDYRRTNSIDVSSADAQVSQQDDHVYCGLVGTTVDLALTGTAELIDPEDASTPTDFRVHTQYSNAATATAYAQHSNSAEREASAACEGVQFSWVAANDFAGGVIKHWRRKTV